MDYNFELHVGWFSAYMLILVLLLAFEMYAVGATSHYTLTRNLLAVVERAPWTGIIVLAFLTWLWVHFAIPIIGILRDWW